MIRTSDRTGRHRAPRLEAGRPQRRRRDFEDLSERGVFVVGSRTNAGQEHGRGRAIFAATFTDDLAESGCAWRHVREEEAA
jgi:hypothetical protein